ncbi:hypothetical protein FACS1894176_07230 [Bacteroidia bacterium]|nr:hypothetical protein FACS1894176_07230 [Bacteroidia bacterium]
MKKFKDSKDPRIKELYSDPITRTPIEKAINDGYTVLFLSEREATNAPLLKLEDIIKPKEILDNSLKGKVFTLDPGHGSMDT